MQIQWNIHMGQEGHPLFKTWPPATPAYKCV